MHLPEKFPALLVLIIESPSLDVKEDNIQTMIQEYDITIAIGDKVGIVLASIGIPSIDRRSRGAMKRYLSTWLLRLCGWCMLAMLWCDNTLARAYGMNSRP